MSAIARFLVEFEPPAAASPWPSTVLAGPAFPDASDDGDAMEGLDDGFGIASEAETGDLGPDGGLEDGSADAGPAAAASADEAVAAALAIAEAEFSQRLAALEEDHARLRAEDRIRWTREEGAALAEGFRKAAAEIEGHIVEAVAAVLQPLVSDLARSVALRGLQDAIASLTAAGSVPMMAVAGPGDLVEALRSSLADGGETSGMTFVVSQDAEVTVTAGDSTIRTRLVEWAASFDGGLGGGA